MKNILKFVKIFLVVGFVFGCKVNTSSQNEDLTKWKDSPNYNFSERSIFDELEFTVRTIKAAQEYRSAENATLTPENYEVTLQSEASSSETLVATLPATVVPKSADILFTFDLTGSMGSAVNQARTNVQNIMDSLRGVIPDSAFGLVSHKDFPIGDFGGGSDYPYRKHVSIGLDTDSKIQEQMAKFKIGGGGNAPESYSFVCYQAYNDKTIGWRENSKKFIVFWLDNLPHPKDPGPDSKPNTDDDLTIDEVLAGLKENNITLIVLCSGNNATRQTWNEYASRTGGAAYAINSGTDIASFIAESVTEQTKRISKLSLEVEQPEYASWVTNLGENYLDIELDSEKTFDFDLTYTVPAGTEDGVYSFTVNLVGDGAIYASHAVSITVVNNKPPVAVIGDDVILEQYTPEGTMHTLSASNCYDPENDELVFTWECNGITYEGVDFTYIFPAGTNLVTLSATEKQHGKSSSASVKVTVIDTVAPSLQLERQSAWWIQDIFDNRFIFVVKAHAVDYGTNDVTITASCLQEFKDGTVEPCATKVLEGNKVYFQLANDGKSRYRNFYLTVTATDNAGNSVSKTEVFKRLP